MVLENFLIDVDVLWDRAGKELYEKPDARAGRKMRVRVTNKGLVEDLTGYALNLGWRSTIDETKFGLDAFDVVDATKGLYELDYTSGMLTNIGTLKAALQLVPTVGNTVESNNFVITVTRSAVETDAIQSESSFTALTSALVEVNGWNARIDDVEQQYIDRANNLDATYPTRLVSVEQQLEQAVENEFSFDKKGLTNVDTINFPVVDSESPIITFVDDDGRSEVYSRLFPIFQAKSEKFVSAVCSNLLNTATFMTELQVKELHDNGHEIINHTSDHLAYNTIPDAEWDREIREGKEWLYRNGYTHDIFVQPQGQGTTGTARDIVRKYAKCAFNGTGQNGSVKLNTFNIVRVDFSSSATKTLDYFKSVVDTCLVSKSWLIFMVHTWNHNDAMDTILGDLIDYINTLNIEIVTASEGFSRKANKLEIDGTVLFDRKGGYDFGEKTIIEATNTRTNSQSVLTYPVGKITVTTIGTSYLVTGGFPFTVGGVLKTDRTGDDGTSYSFSKQYFETATKNEIWTRTWNGGTGGSWLAWQKVTPIDAITTIKKGSASNGLELNFSSIPANSSVTQTVTVSGVAFGMAVIFNVKGTIADGLICNCWVSAAGTLSFRVTNTTGAALTFVRNWDYAVVQLV